jgi:hypothetical protein
MLCGGVSNEKFQCTLECINDKDNVEDETNNYIAWCEDSLIVRKHNATIV